MRDRRILAAALWFVLAFLVWNVRFDFGVRASARSYINQRALFLRGAGPRIEMASAMRAGIHDSAAAGDGARLAFAVAFAAAIARMIDPLSVADAQNARHLVIRRRRASMRGSASRNTSPTVCRLLALTWSRVSSLVCQAA